MPIMLGKHTRTRSSAFFTKRTNLSNIQVVIFFFIRLDIHKTALPDVNKYLKGNEYKNL